MLLGLGTACPLTYVIAYNLNIPFGWLMLYLFLSVCLILFIDFRKGTRASFLNFIFRFMLALSIGFILFYFSPLWVRITVAIYALVLLSVLAYATSDMFHKIGVLCLILLGFNLFIGLLDYRSSTFAGYGTLLTVSTGISTLCLLSFFIVLNVDSIRWFGTDGLSVPNNMKFASFAIIAAGGVLLTVISFSPWLAETGRFLLGGVIRLVNNFFRYIFSFNSSDQPVNYESQPQNDPPVFDMFDDPETGTYEVDPILMWLGTGIILAAFLSLVVIALVKIIRFLLRLYRTGIKRVAPGNEVFTEIIEKITHERGKRTRRDIKKVPSYSSLKTERERILYIYREYVRKAKRCGFTSDNFSDTPNEVLSEIFQNASGGSFPLPDNLTAAFNTVRYSNENIESIDVYELKQRLL